MLSQIRRKSCLSRMRQLDLGKTRRQAMITSKKTISLFMVFLWIAVPTLAEEIHDGALQGDLAKVKMLLSKNPKLLDVRSENEKTPLHYASQGGHLEIVEFLIARGADVNSKNIADETPLHYAAALGHKKVVDLLIDKEAILASENINGSIPLHNAANNGQIDIVRLLIEKGSDVNHRNKFGQTPLDLAYQFNQSEVIQLIVSKGGSLGPLKDPQVVHLSGSVYSILFPFGNQSNLGCSVGQDGFLLIDTGFSQRAETKISAAISKLGKGQIKYIINTHLHQDHTACNSIGGDSATIISHQKLEKMLSEGIIFPSEKPIKGRTGKTFGIQYSLKFNGEEIKLIPYPGIHSEEDLIIYLAGSGVVHMGDLLISESFPSVGGNVIEYMELLDSIIDIFPPQTKFISGHGKNYTFEDVVNYQRMLLATIEIVRKNMEAGKSVREMRREKVLKGYETWNIFIPFLNTDYWIEAVYNSYKDEKERSIAA